MVTSVHARPHEHLVLDFLAYLEFERGLSRNTLEAYRSDLLQFGGWMEQRGVDPVDAQHADLAGFLTDLATGNPPDRAAGRQRDASAQSRMPALLLPPPASRGGHQP